MTYVDFLTLGCIHRRQWLSTESFLRMDSRNHPEKIRGQYAIVHAYPGLVNDILSGSFYVSTDELTDIVLLFVTLSVLSVADR